MAQIKMQIQGKVYVIGSWLKSIITFIVDRTKPWLSSLIKLIMSFLSDLHKWGKWTPEWCRAISCTSYSFKVKR